MLFVLTVTGGLDGGIDREILKHVWPALAIFGPTLFYLCPFDNLTIALFGVHKNGFVQRWMLLEELAAVICSPFTEPFFHRCFIADILCSMPRVLPDLQYTLCIYLTGSFWEKVNERDEWEHDPRMHAYNTCGGGSPIYSFCQLILACLPFHIRLWQCIRAYVESGIQRHLLNAIKYCITLLLTGLAIARTSFDPVTNAKLVWLWVAVGIVATIYSFTWDVVYDWLVLSSSRIWPDNSFLCVNMFLYVYAGD
jgi:hypothetical protein